MAGYDAFISYSHAADGRLAPALRVGLERLAKPWNRRRALRIFHDSSGLGVTPQLWETIRSALESSRFFVLLASPEAAGSRWVNQEVSHFLGKQQPDRVLIVLTGGECRWNSRSGDFDRMHSTAIPPALLGKFPGEPLYLDLRWAKSEEQLDLRNARFRTHLADLAAPIHGMPPDDLDARDLHEFRKAQRFRRFATSLIAVLAIVATVVGIVAVVNARESARQRNVAERNLALAEGRRLAAEAQAVTGRQTDLALLLALESLRRERTPEGIAALATALTIEDAKLTPLRGHTNIVSDVASSPKLGLVATGSSDSSIRFWDTRSKEEVGEPLTNTHSRGIKALAFSGGGDLLTSVGFDGVARVWDVRSRRAVGIATNAYFADVSYSPSAELMASAGFDGTIRIWTPRLDLEQALLGSLGKPAVAVTFSADGSMLAVAAEDGELRLWRLDGQQFVPAGTTPPGGAVSDLAFSPDGRLIVTAGKDGRLHRWAVPSLSEVGPPLAGHGEEATGVTFSPDGGTIVSSGLDGTVRLWSLATGAPLTVLSNNGIALYGAEITPDGTAIVTGGRDGQAHLWLLSSAKLVRPPFTGHSDRVLSVALGSGGQRLVTTGRDGRVLVRDSSTGELLTTEGERHDGSVPTSAVSPDGSVLATGGVDGIVQIRRLNDALDPGRLLAGHKGPVYDVKFKPDGTMLASASEDGTVRFWDPVSGDPVGAPLVVSPARDARTVYGRQVQALTFSPDGNRLATASFDGFVRVWDLNTRALAFDPLPADLDGLTDVAFSPDGRRLAAAGLAGLVFLWDLATSTPAARTLIRHEGAVNAVTFTPDSASLASAGVDGAIQLWTSDTGEALGEPFAVGSELSDLEFSGDGRLLFSAGGDGVVRVWPGPTSWEGFACRLAGRNLSDTEWSTFIGTEIPYRETC